MRLSIGLKRALRIAAIVPAMAVRPAAAQEGAVDPATEPTTIDARRLEVNYDQNVAVFVGDVVVVDPQLRLTADRLTVNFDPGSNRIARIDAEGRVEIRQADKNGAADSAVYTVDDGRIVLQGNARVYRERDLLTADRIIFFREEERMIAEPNPRLTLYPEQEGVQGRLFDPMGR